MLIDLLAATYLVHVTKAIMTAQLTGPDLPPTTCPECDRVMGLFTNDDHLVTAIDQDGTLGVVIGCEGYWTVNPERVGLPRNNWMSPDDM